jgi:hypothetical protein
VVFGPSWGTAYIIRSPEQELEVRDRMRRFTIGCWLFALGCLLLGLAGRFTENWLWIATKSLAVLKTAAIIRLVVMLSYSVTCAGWIWWSLRCLTAGLEPTPASWAFSSRLQRAALHNTDGGLVLKASMGALVGIASAVVLISFRSIAWREAVAVATIGVVGLGFYLWYRLLMRVREVGLPNKAAAGDGRHGAVR